MAQSLINVIKIFLPIIISGNVLISACSSIRISSVSHTLSDVPVYEHPHGFDSPVTDVVRLHDAIIDDDRSKIIDIFLINNLYNRQFFHAEHLIMYGSDLKSLCQSHLSGNFGHLITSLATPTWYFLANEVHHFFSQSSHRDFSTLEEILGYHDIEMIEEAYRSEYGVEMMKHFRKLPYSVRQLYVNREFAQDQANYYHIKLEEAVRESNIRHFTRLIVLILNDGKLDEVRMSYRSVYGKPLASLIDELPYGDYRKAISAILSPPEPYGDDMMPSSYDYEK